MLVPLLQRMALQGEGELSVFGGDYNTRDGSAVRDYIHIQDLVDAHVKALRRLDLQESQELEVFNLGSGEGSTVFEVLDAFSHASGRRLAPNVQARRPGDAAFAVADPSLAHQVLGWRATRKLDQILTSAWEFIRANPDGFKKDPPYPRAVPGVADRLRDLAQLLFPDSTRLHALHAAIMESSKVVGRCSAVAQPNLRGLTYVVDWGGSTLRVLRFAAGAERYSGEAEIISEHLKAQDASPDELFDFMADVVARVFHRHGDAGQGQAIPLCFVVSFALSFESFGPTKAVTLTHWAKDWATPGIQGQNLAELMAQALARRRLPLKVTKVLNDCVASLFALSEVVADAAVVVGTGTNACFVRRKSGSESEECREVLSTEWGGITSGLPVLQADRDANNGGEVNLERMVSGLYLPRIVQRLHAQPAEGTLCPKQELATSMEAMEACSAADSGAIQSCEFVTARSAAICAKALAAVLDNLARAKAGKMELMEVVLDGALFHKLPQYFWWFKHHLLESLRPQLQPRVRLHLVKDAASLGAVRVADGSVFFQHAA